MRVATLALIALFVTFSRLPAQSQLIQAAIFPLPEALRNGAAVVRLDEAGKPVTLRAGTNGIVCITDRPGDDYFDVRCYQASFIQVVYRAFQLGYGISGEKVEAEIKAGLLELSNEPSAGYRCLGPADSYNGLKNSLSARAECWQSIHFPFRTAREIGLPDEAEVPESMQTMVPYVMASGSYWSHVMIRHSPKW